MTCHTKIMQPIPNTKTKKKPFEQKQQLQCLVHSVLSVCLHTIKAWEVQECKIDKWRCFDKVFLLKVCSPAWTSVPRIYCVKTILTFTFCSICCVKLEITVLGLMKKYFQHIEYHYSTCFSSNAKPLLSLICCLL